MWTEQKLDELLATPSERLVEDVKKIKGDIMVLGAGGKMGPSLCLLAQNAVKAAGTDSKIIAVSRFTDPIATKLLHDNGIQTISADLLKDGAVEGLPEVENVIYMAGRKFGTNGQEPLTWAMNAWLPVLVAKKFKKSNLVAFSSGNIYPNLPAYSGGADETVAPSPVGEYGMSCLGRERMFEYASMEYGSKVFLYRLNYAVDLRYGVLYDIASKIVAGEPVSLATPAFNCIWQHDANEIAIRALLHTGSPAVKMNITGPEIISVRRAAEKMAQYLGKEVVFEGEPNDRQLMSNSSKAVETFGYPTVGVETLLRWQAEWLLDGGRALGKPTHFEEKEGKY